MYHRTKRMLELDPLPPGGKQPPLVHTHGPVSLSFPIEVSSDSGQPSILPLGSAAKIRRGSGLWASLFSFTRSIINGHGWHVHQHAT